jgi:ATP-binding cassette subfamily B protein
MNGHTEEPEGASGTQETTSPWRRRLAGLNNAPFILRLVWDAAPRVFLLNLGARVLTAFIPVATLWVSKMIIDLVVASTKHPGPVPLRIWWLVAAEFGLAGGASVLSRTIGYCEARLADELSREVNLRVMRHATSLDLVSFEDPSFYDILERARVQAGDRVELVSAFGNLVQQTVALVSLAAGVILFSFPVFVLLVVSLVPAFVAETRFAFLGYSLAHSLTPLRREMDYIRMLGTSKEAAKETQVFALGRYLVDRFAARNRELIARNRSLQVRRFRLGSIFSAIGLLGYYGSYAYVVWQTLQSRLTIGTLTFLVGALAGTSAQIQSVFSTFAAIADQALFLSDLREFLAVAPKIRSTKRRGLPVPQPIRDGFEFRKVSFHYPDSERLVLDQLDLRIVPGERLALVGENGQGKTTCMKLLARLYEPTSGQILLDGVDLREYNLEDLHRQVGVIFQDFVRYDLTARENIGLGCVDQLADERRILEAAWNSHATDIIGRLPDGLGQMLGRRFAGGVELSGGEWQRIALARAYMCNAQILILDEPTAALDAAAESDLFERFAALIEGRMAVLISHRFATVRMCDKIVVLEGGRLHEEGSHDELMARDGRYAHLFRLQAAQYT